MAYGSQFIKVTWLCAIDNTEEIADTSLNYTKGPGWTGAVAALGKLKANTSGNALGGFMFDLLHNTNGLWWANYSYISGVKIAAVGTNGHYLTDPYVYDKLDLPNWEGNAGGVLPQSSLVVTLRAANSLGKGNLGRMYLPHTAIEPVVGTPMGSEITAQTIASKASAFILACNEEINNQVDDDIYPHIMSQATGSPTKVVYRVSVGNVTDTQRRRRNRLREVYKHSVVSL